MKSKILASLTGLMNANELEEKVNLQIKVSYLIELADFGMDKESELLKKTEIISALDSYIENSDEIHKQLLQTHFAFIASQNVT
jgi:hypothetical protein